jgi:hypothetical protein
MAPAVRLVGLDTPFAPARDATVAEALDATESGMYAHVRGTRSRGPWRGSVVPSLPSTIAAPRASPSVPKGQNLFGLRQEFCLKKQLVS